MKYLSRIFCAFLTAPLILICSYFYIYGKDLFVNEHLEENTLEEFIILPAPSLLDLRDMHPTFEPQCERISNYSNTQEHVHTHSKWQAEVGEILEDTYVDNQFHQRSRIKFSIIHLRRVIYRFFGTKPFCDSMPYYEERVREKYASACPTTPENHDQYCKNFIPNRTLEVMPPEIAKTWYPYLDLGSSIEIDVISLRHVISYGADFAGCDTRLVLREACGFQKRRIYKSGKWKRKFKDFKKLNNAFIIAQSNGYYHFVAEILPRMIFFLPQIVEKNMTVVVAHDSRYVTEYFELLGVESWAFATSPHYVEQGWTTEASWCTCNRHSQVALLSNVLRFKVSDGDPIESTDIIVIRRTGHSGNRRAIENWDEMWAALYNGFPEENFILFQDESHSMGLRNWAKLYMKAKIIIGCFGAGLTNMVFANPGTVIIEISSYGRGFLYLHLATSLGMKFYGLSTGFRYKVDINEIVLAVKTYLDAEKIS